TVTANGEAAGDTATATFTGLTTYVYALPTDYAPGQTANLYAGGFTPGETVDFQITNLTTGTVYAPWSVADGSSTDLDAATNGNIQTGWLVPSDALGCTLQVTATGETSGLTVVNSFTDAPATKVGAVAVLHQNPLPVNAGSTAAFDLTITRKDQKNAGGNLTVDISVTNLPAGATYTGPTQEILGSK